MGDAYDNGYQHMGNTYEVVYRNTTSGDPTMNELSAWVDTYDLFCNTLGPGVTDGNGLLSAFERRECTYLIETGCMTILDKNCTCTSGLCTTSFEEGLTVLETALGGGGGFQVCSNPPP